MNKLVPRQSLYTKLIVELTGCTLEEAPLVEGIMRVTYSTLDGLDRARFRREAKTALQAARLDPDLARDTANSYGLLITPRQFDPERNAQESGYLAESYRDNPPAKKRARK